MRLTPTFRAFVSAVVGLGSIALVSSALGQPAASTPAPEGAPPVSVVEQSVVKIFSTIRAPDQIRPWSKQSPREATGSGVIIPGNRILTNAHVVTYASQIQVQGHQSGEKILATVESVSHGMDLAVLKLEDDTFFEGRPPMRIAPKLPSVKDTVMVYGYPTGGSSLSITKGIVSRIEFVGYGFPMSGLRIQIDAAINAGNSGGPALSGDEMIGIAFSRLGGGDNIGYIIPSEEIELFLRDTADGKYDGKPMFFDELQTLQNPGLRAFLKLERGVSGMVVTRPDSNDPAYPLQRWDVITHIGDMPVDDEGMVRIGEHRLRFAARVQTIAKDGVIPLTVVRKGKTEKIQLPVPRDRPMLIEDLNGEYPPYFIYGPLVFSVPSAQFVGGMMANANAMNALGRLGVPMITRRHERPAFAGEQLVIVSSPLLPHRIGRGYSNPTGRVLDTVNGTKIRNLAHLVEVLRDAKDEFVVFAFAGIGMDSMVFPRTEATAAVEELLGDNGIRAQGSPALMAIWDNKK